MRRFADSMFFALPVFFLRRKKFLFPYVVVVNLYILSNLLYYRNYGTIMPLSSYVMVENLDGLGPSIVNSLRKTDVWLVFPSICFMIFYCIVPLTRFPQQRPIESWQNFFLSVFPIAFIIVPSYLFHSPTDYAHPFGLYRNEIVRAYRQLGFINYYLYEIKYLKGVSEKERQSVVDFMNEYGRSHMAIENLSKSVGKNLIVILVESLQSWPIGLSVSGTEVTPCLNKIIHEAGTLYFPKVLPQVKGGRSSDAQLLINTGLLPIANGATASLYGTQKYPSLANALRERGYYSLSLLCDNKTYWNQEATTKSYGFDALYDRLAGDLPMTRADENLFKYGLSILKQVRQPFYAQLVTMSGHDAVKTDLKNPFGKISDKDIQVEYNLIITHYVDSCIGKFVSDLKHCGLYDNSVVVIAGDHDALTYNRFVGRDSVYLSDRYVPFVILNAPSEGVDCRLVIGQSDIYPTLLDLMGVSDYYFRGLGESVFRQPNGFAVYHTGEVEGDCTNDSLLANKRELWRISDLMIRMNYFRDK